MLENCALTNVPGSRIIYLFNAYRQKDTFKYLLLLIRFVIEKTGIVKTLGLPPIIISQSFNIRYCLAFIHKPTTNMP
jgi:hypothetical protein